MAGLSVSGGPRRGVVIAVAAAVGIAGSAFGVWMRHNSSAVALQAQEVNALNLAGQTPDSSSGPQSAAPTSSAAPLASPGGTPGSTAGASASASVGTSATAKPSAKPSAPKPAAPVPNTSATCKNPAFVTSDTGGGWTNGAYYVHNNMWNASEAGPETLYACSYKNWYVISNQRNLPSNPGSVKTYPNVHKDYNGEKVSSFSRITSTFAGISPHVGINDVAYDIWLNGVGDGANEVMIWTDNYKQVPSGDKVARQTFDGVTYDVWKTGDNKYIALVPTHTMTSGTLDLLAMFKYLIGQGWLSSGSTMGQICYGIEFVDTGGTNQRFTVTDFSITDK